MKTAAASDGWSRLLRHETPLRGPGEPSTWETPSVAVADVVSVFASPGRRLGISHSRKMCAQVRRPGGRGGGAVYHRFDNLESLSFTRTGTGRIRVVRVSGCGRTRSLSGIGVPVGLERARSVLYGLEADLDDLLGSTFGARSEGLFPLLEAHPNLNHWLVPGPLANAPDLDTATAELFGRSRATPELAGAVGSTHPGRLHAAMAVRDVLAPGELVDYLRDGPEPDVSQILPWTVRRLRPVLARADRDSARSLVYALGHNQTGHVNDAIRAAEKLGCRPLSFVTGWDEVCSRLRTIAERAAPPRTGSDTPGEP